MLLKKLQRSTSSLRYQKQRPQMNPTESLTMKMTKLDIVVKLDIFVKPYPVQSVPGRDRLKN